MSSTSRRTVTARKRYKPEEIVAKLRQVDVLVSQGQNIADVIRQIGVSEVTYYRWRHEFGGLKIEQVKRLKDLELENSRPCVPLYSSQPSPVNRGQTLADLRFDQTSAPGGVIDRVVLPPVIDAGQCRGIRYTSHQSLT
jgi:putative transposase